MQWAEVIESEPHPHSNIIAPLPAGRIALATAYAGHVDLQAIENGFRRITSPFRTAGGIGAGSAGHPARITLRYTSVYINAASLAIRGPLASVQHDTNVRGPAPEYGPNDLLPRQRLAEELTALGFSISRKTLENHFHRGDGPPYRIWGAGPRALYEWGPALEWARGRLSRPIRKASEISAR